MDGSTRAPAPSPPLTHPNRLGLRGWVVGGRWGPERYLYTLHRLTGLGLVLYLLLHVVVTSSRALGADAWMAAMASVTGPLFRLAEFLVFAAFVFHGSNGLRLVLIELGFLTGRPEEPVYPYRSSLDVQRPWTLVLMLAAAALLAFGGWEFLTLGP